MNRINQQLAEIKTKLQNKFPNYNIYDNLYANISLPAIVVDVKKIQCNPLTNSGFPSPVFILYVILNIDNNPNGTREIMIDDYYEIVDILSDLYIFSDFKFHISSVNGFNSYVGSVEFYE